MARAQNDVYVVGATRIAVGPSAIIRTPTYNNQVAVSVKSASGGSLEIVQPNTTPAGWGNGWMLLSGEVVRAEGPAVFYLVASGATAVASVNWEYSYGATLV